MTTAVTGLRDWALASATRGLSVVDRALNEEDIRLAITGLSGAGKTVFLTSLIANLLAMAQGRATLPALQAVLDRHGAGRLRGVRLVPPGAGATPPFDIAAKLADLAGDSPHWPARTDHLAEIALELEIGPRGGMLGQMRGFVGTRRLRLRLLDYPGEWLLDLPLLGQSFAEWSRETLALLRQSPRAEAARPFLDYLGQIDGRRQAEEALVRRGHRLYREALARAQSEHGLRWLQPGRFLAPGPGVEQPFLWFFPIEGTGGPGSMIALMSKRYDAYRADMRGRLEALRGFDRRVVLVDVLGALAAGRAAFEDTERAIAAIGASLGGGRWFGRAARVAFVATKADHVPELERVNLRELLKTMAGPVAGASFHVAASIVSTTDGWADRPDGQREDVVWGRVLGEAAPRAYRVGSVPIRQPPAGFWSGRSFRLPIFTPPAIDPSGATGVPHLGLDTLLADVIGDRL